RPHLGRPRYCGRGPARAGRRRRGPRMLARTRRGPQRQPRPGHRAHWLMTLDVSFLPQLTEAERSALTWTTFTRGGITLEAPEPSPALVTTLTERLRAAQRTHL